MEYFHRDAAQLSTVLQTSLLFKPIIPVSNNMNKRTASKEYTNVNAQTGVVDADPHRLIQMLYSGALEQIAVAKGCMQRSEIAGKGEAISKAIGIVNGLQGSVNHDIDSDGLTDRLSSLYEFVTR